MYHPITNNITHNDDEHSSIIPPFRNFGEWRCFRFGWTGFEFLPFPIVLTHPRILPRFRVIVIVEVIGTVRMGVSSCFEVVVVVVVTLIILIVVGFAVDVVFE